jgi:hypothetical protein
MSDNELCKKFWEEEDAFLFLEARERATGEALEIRPHERPDFIGTRTNGREVGIELTSVMLHPHPPNSSEAHLHEPEEVPDSMVARLVESLQEKAESRANYDEPWRDNTILVLQLVDVGFSGTLHSFADALEEDARESGFAEVWLSDLTERDAFDNIEIFCLVPPSLHGHYPRANLCEKPFG